jgi:hypothetical protein
MIAALVCSWVRSISGVSSSMRHHRRDLAPRVGFRLVSSPRGSAGDG